MDKKPKFIDEEDRHPIAGDNNLQVGSQLVEHQEATPAMWPVVGYDPAHTGRCPHDTSRNTGHLKWWAAARDALSPVIGADGTVYLGVSGMLRAVRPDGWELWYARYLSALTCHCSPGIGPDGLLYLGARFAHGLWVVHPGGTEISLMTVNDRRDQFDLCLLGHSPIIGPDGTIYATSDEGDLFVFSPDRVEKWNFGVSLRQGDDCRGLRCPGLDKARQLVRGGDWTRDLRDFGLLRGPPAIAPDGTVYLGTGDGRLCALRPGGIPKWIFDSGPVSTSPAVAPDGTVYVGTAEGLLALSPDGTPRWRYRTPGPVLSSCAIAGDGTIYFGSDDGSLRALNPEGTKKWKHLTGGAVLSSPAISAEGTIYFGSCDGYLRALDPDGLTKWKHKTAGPVISAPAIAADGTVYVTSTDGYLYALGAQESIANPASGVDTDVAARHRGSGEPVLYVGPGGEREQARLDTAARTDIGRSRQGRNEDAVGLHRPTDAKVLDDYGILLVVADGVGGSPYGYEASRIAVKTVMKAYYEARDGSAQRALEKAFNKANAAVFLASKEPDHHGLCTTLVAAAVFPDHCVFANVGDSRGYVIPSSGGLVRQVTIDHSEVQEMVQHGLMAREQAEVASNRNIITRVLGTSRVLKVDVFDIQLSQGDTVMLCSDGLVTAVSDAEIASIIQNSPLDVAVDRLVELAKGPKGHDNVTVCAASLTKGDTLR